MGKAFSVVLIAVALLSVALFYRFGAMPPLASNEGGAIDAQFRNTWQGAAVIFLIAQLALAAFIWKSSSARQGASRFPGGSTVTILLAVGFVAFELVSAGTLGRNAWAALYPRELAPEALRVQALGVQFAFYFRYPGADGKFGPIHVKAIDDSTGNHFGIDRERDESARDDVITTTLAVPVNRPVELLLDARDVIHGFYVRELRIQRDMVPGMEVPVRFTASKTGSYEIVCAQLCGLGHYGMHSYLEVMTEPQFEAWLARSYSPQSHRGAEESHK
jgi:cytochrome c oxidase subunit 2